MNPEQPIFIPSKSRADLATTPAVLDDLGVPYRLIVEEEQYTAYRERFPAEHLIVLDKSYQDNYDTCDDLGYTKSKGSGAARNMAGDVARAEGATWHWVIDDNIKAFLRANKNRRYRVADGAIFAYMESFADRYTNVAMAGPCYFMFAPARLKRPPFGTGTRLYSCNLIRNDVSLRWRGRYNEDTILSLDMLKAGWATVQFNAFQQWKLSSQLMKGGNTEAWYAREGTLPKSQMLVDQHPDVARLTHKWGRWHHHVDYSQWRGQPLIRKPDVVIPTFANHLATPEELAQRSG